MEEKYYKVYIHINKMNKKSYVGITKQDIRNRWQYGNGYKTGRFRNALKKYGWDGFEHIVLKDELTEKVAKETEKLLIKTLDLTNEDNGYNMTEGGDGISGFIVSESTKKKISIKLIGRKFDKSTLIKMSESARKRCHSDQTITKLKEISKGHLNNFSKSIICVTTEELFECMRYAKDKYGKTLHLTECCNGKLKSAGKHPITGEKLRWMYYNEYIEIANKELLGFY